MCDEVTERRSKFRGAAAIICISVLMFFFASIGVRFVTRQLLIKRWGWDNAFTQAVFADRMWMENEGIEICIDWEALYPFDDTQIGQTDAPRARSLGSKVKRIVDKVYDIEGRIEYYASDMLVGHDAIVLAARRCDDLLGAEIVDSARSIISLKNGYYVSECAEVARGDIADAADGIADFARFLAERDTPFIYVNAGGKVCPVDKKMRYKDLPREMSNENADALLAELVSRGVTTLDMREELLASGRDWYDSYYRTDCHWTTGTGVWAAGVLARRLNADFGFDIDERIFDPSSYTIDRREDFWLGSEGRQLARAKIERDSFEAYLPNFSTNLRFTCPSRGIDEIGTLPDVLMNTNTLEKIESYGDKEILFAPGAYAYGSFIRIGNDPLLSVENLMPVADSGKRVLLIRDSFCFYVIPFLSCGVGRVDAIHNQSFTGSLRRYVQETSPDVVIMMPLSHAIAPVELNTHTSALDTR